MYVVFGLCGLSVVLLSSSAAPYLSCAAPSWAATHPNLSCAAPYLSLAAPYLLAAPHPSELRRTPELRRTLLGTIRDIRQRDIKYFAHVSQESNRVGFDRMVFSINIMLKLCTYLGTVLYFHTGSLKSLPKLLHPILINIQYIWATYKFSILST